MTKRKQKYYVVWKGHNPGVYTDWNECHYQIKGFSSPVFKAFLRYDIAKKAFLEEPEKYLHQDYLEPPIFNFTEGIQDAVKSEKPVIDALTVDAACSINPGVMEYRGVDLQTGNEVFRQGPFPYGTNNIGEFLAIVHALALMKRKGDNRPVYSDSEIAISWVFKRQARTQLEKNDQTKALYDLIRRAEIWLQTNQWNNEVIKWDTKKWGEIPADFGRK